MFATLTEIDEGLRAVMDALDPAVLHGSDAVAALKRFSTIEKMAAAGRMLMGKRVAETNAWQSSGKPTAEAFLASIAGCSLAEAHRMLGTAKKLGRLPDTEKAARRGELSTGQAGDIADAASVDPTAEQSLLDLSKKGSASELREEARKRRHAATENDQRRHNRIRNNRALRTWTDDEGASRLSWSHLPEAGAEVGTILADYIDEQFAEARRTGRRERREAYAADAFVEALRDAAAYRRGETIDDEPDDDRADAPFDRRGGERPAQTAGTGDVAGPAGRADPSDLPDVAGPAGRADSSDLPDVAGAPHDQKRRGDGEPVAVADADADADAEGRRGDRADRADGAGQRSGDPASSSASDRRHDCVDRPETNRSGRPGGPRRSEADRFGDGVAPAEPPPPGVPSAPSAPGAPEPSPPNRASRRRRAMRRRGADAKVIVLIDHAALVRGHTEAGETCTIAGIGAVPVASVRALMDDAFLAAVITDGHDVSTVAHLGRQPSVYQDTALQAQGVECSTLGCPNRFHLERDHRVPYRVSRHTTLRELDFSCPPCHDRKTYFGDMLAPGTGKRPLLTRAEQVQWNIDHPDNPCDAPQTSYPNRPTPPRAAATTTAMAMADAASRPTAQALTLDL